MKIISSNQYAEPTEVISLRNSLSRFNDFSIQELVKLPHFVDWVDCNVDEAVSFRMFLAAADDGVALRYFWNGKYEPSSMRLWTNIARKLPAGHTAIDIGAHTGCYTLAARKANSELNVLAIEPNLMNFARLVVNLKGNQLSTDNLMPFAAGSKSQILPLHIPTSLDYLSSGGTLTKINKKSVIYVDVKPVDDLVALQAGNVVDLIKIDVEGHEEDCLEGLNNTIASNKPIIFFECISSDSGKGAERQLRDHGYIFSKSPKNPEKLPG